VPKAFDTTAVRQRQIKKKEKQATKSKILYNRLEKKREKREREYTARTRATRGKYKIHDKRFEDKMMLEMNLNKTC